MTDMIAVTLAIAVVHAYTFGQVLNYGAVMDSVQADFNATRTDASFVGDAQFGAFIAAGILAKFFNFLGVEFRAVTLAMVTVWGVGMLMVSILPSISFDEFAYTYIIMGGLGAGLLFWHTLSVLPSWAQKADGGPEQALTKSYLVISIAPAAYQALNSYLFSIGGHTRNFNLLYIVAIPGLVSMWIASMFIHTRNPGVSDKAFSSLTEIGRETGAEIKQMKDATKASWSSGFFLFLFAVAIYQFAFFSPYVLLPDFAEEKFAANSTDVGLIMSMLGTGSVVGRFLIVGWFMFAHFMFPAKKDGKERTFLDTTTIGTMTLTFVLFATLNSTENIAGVVAWSFFYGVVSSATMFCIVVRVLVKFQLEDSEKKQLDWVQTKLAWLCFASLPGAFMSAWATSKIEDDVGYNGAIWFNAGMSGGAALVLFLFALMHKGWYTGCTRALSDEEKGKSVQQDDAESGVSTDTDD
jgi:hypothetical protein